MGECSLLEFVSRDQKAKKIQFELKNDLDRVI